MNRTEYELDAVSKAEVKAIICKYCTCPNECDPERGCNEMQEINNLFTATLIVETDDIWQ